MSRTYPDYESVRQDLDSIMTQLWGFLTVCGNIEVAVRVGGYREAVTDLWWIVNRERAIDSGSLRDRLQVLTDVCPPEVAHLRQRLTRVLDRLEAPRRGTRTA